jgi:hypothetical protein
VFKVEHVQYPKEENKWKCEEKRIKRMCENWEEKGFDFIWNNSFYLIKSEGVQ